MSRRRQAALPVLVSPDSFKGTLSAAEVAAAVARGLRAVGREAVELPVADGGEGTMDALVTAHGGELHSVSVHDPLGRPVDARYARLADGHTAVVEMAEASGLGLVAEGERDPWAASTYGTGELIAAAVEAGATEVIVACGGSGTIDGGAGALEALTEAGARPRLRCACDVKTAWEDAPGVFGPQKGADARTVKRLERRLDALAEAAPRDPRGVPMTGAAGGLSGGLWAHLGAKLVPGAALVLEELGFDQLMRDAAIVVTGEGQLDLQTLAGKAVGEVATRCRQAGVACHAVVGRNELDLFEQRLLDLASVTEAGSVEQLEAAGQALA